MGYKFRIRESVSVGDKVMLEELMGIYGVHIIVEFERSGDLVGTVIYAGDDEIEAAKYDRPDNITSYIYNDPRELNGESDE